MDQPTAKQELKVLRDVVEQMSDVEVTWRKQVRLRRGIFLIASVILVVVFMLAMNDILGPFTSALLGGFGGAVLGMGLMFETILAQWPITSRYVDVEAVKARLAELESAVV